MPFLHFELCYYQAIDYAIAHKLKTVEAGAQGEHKLARGYAPSTTYSVHWIAHPGLRDAIADYLERERAVGRAQPGSAGPIYPVPQGRADGSIRAPIGPTPTVASPGLDPGATLHPHEPYRRDAITLQ